MKYLSLVVMSLFLLSACQQSGTHEDAAEEVSVNENVVADAESKLALEGMVCSMGCVSAIQNELRATPGVAFAAVNYEESFASIKYDSKLVSEEELIAAIEGIGDHSYSAKKYDEADEAEEDTEMEETIEVMEAVESVVAH